MGYSMYQRQYGVPLGFTLWFDHFYDSRAEIFKSLLVVWSKQRHQKDILINWPLEIKKFIAKTCVNFYKNQFLQKRSREDWSSFKNFELS